MRGKVRWGLPPLFFLLSMAVSARIVDLTSAQVAAGAGRGSGSLLVEISRRPAFSFGFRNFLADVAWLQAVQVAGSGKMVREDYDRLSSLLDAVTRYDRRFLIPYLVGGVLLSDSPPHAADALRILARGRENYPGEWRLPFYMGYIWYYVAGDSRKGAVAMRDAALLEGCPPFVGPLAARMYGEGNDPETALSFLENLIRMEEDPVRRNVFERRRVEVLVERDLRYIENAVAAYRKSFGRTPGGVPDLVRVGLLKEIPRDPSGGEYRLLSDGTVRNDSFPARLKVFRR
jgi:hypothetical protein